MKPTLLIAKPRPSLFKIVLRAIKDYCIVSDDVVWLRKQGE